MNRNIIALIALLSWPISLCKIPAATITWTNPSGGNWNVANNWSPNRLPTNGDIALNGSIMTGSTPVQLQSPKISVGNFIFSFGTTNGPGHTVQQNTNLATSNWTYFTNIVGTGSLYQIITPVTSVPQLFFHVRQP